MELSSFPNEWFNHMETSRLDENNGDGGVGVGGGGIVTTTLLPQHPVTPNKNNEDDNLSQSGLRGNDIPLLLQTNVNHLSIPTFTTDDDDDDGLLTPLSVDTDSSVGDGTYPVIRDWTEKDFWATMEALNGWEDWINQSDDDDHDHHHDHHTMLVTSTTQDVLLGRGAMTNHHPGNVQFRAVAAQLRPDYVATTSKLVKRRISQQLVTIMKRKGARFLKKYTNDGTTNNYFEVEDDIAINKSSQAIREDPEVSRVRRQIRNANQRPATP
jgi:hypothetical protein